MYTWSHTLFIGYHCVHVFIMYIYVHVIHMRLHNTSIELQYLTLLSLHTMMGATL